MNVCTIQGMSVAESIVSGCFTLSAPRVAGMRTLVDGNRVVQNETSRTIDN